MPVPIAILGRYALLPERPAAIPAEWVPPGLEPAPNIRLLGTGLDRRPHGMARWPRLDRYCRAVAIACDGAFVREEHPAAPTGLTLVSLFSCLETNAEFDRGLIEKGPRLASPKLFPYTLPGAGGAEAAMVLDLRGAQVTFTGGPAMAAAACLCATDTLATDQTEQAQRLLVVAADVLGPHTLRSLHEMDGPSCFDPAAPPLAEGCAGLWLGRADDPRPGPRVFLDGALGPASLDTGGWAELIHTALDRVDLTSSDIACITNATNGPAARASIQTGARDALGDRADGILHLCWRCGAAGAPLLLFALADAIDNGENAATLVLAADDTGSAALVSSPAPIHMHR